MENIESIRRFWDSVQVSRFDQVSIDIDDIIWDWLNPDSGPDPLLKDVEWLNTIQRCISFLETNQGYHFHLTYFFSRYAKDELKCWPFAPHQSLILEDIPEKKRE